ncbi:hypothetical protein F4801DRAFT_533345 [Xylaria longipes]|nr:hypothetical protein F4801DRAFT_533345 [Xylaria longipes]
MMLLSGLRLLLLLFLAGLGESAVVSRYSNVNLPTVIGRQDDLPEDSALCIPSCELGTCGNGGSCSIGSMLLKRNLGLDSIFNSSDHEFVGALEKRLFTYTPGSTDEKDYTGRTAPKLSQVNGYIPAVDNGGEDGYFHAPLPTIELDGGGGIVDERAVSQQVAFGDDPFQIISTNVYGCTVIVVASTRGVWMTHLWESYSNGKDSEGNNLDTPGDPAFGQRVLMFLKGDQVSNPAPNGYKDYIAPRGPGIDTNLYNNKRTDQTTVFIFTPCKPEYDTPSEGCLKYPNRYGRNGEVVKTIGEIFGVRRPKVALVPYVPLNTNDPRQSAELGTNNRGAALFQYDPNSDGNGKKAWRLFLEKRFDYLEVP